MNEPVPDIEGSVCFGYEYKIITEESVLHKPDRAISNYFYNNGGTEEMTYKALCISDGEKWNFDFRRMVLVKG